VFEDLVADPVKAYRGLLEFLELPEDGRTELRRKNENREYKHAWLQAYVMNPPRPIAALLESLQRRGRSRPRWIRATRRRLKEWNTRKASRPPLDPAMRATLGAVFAEDVDRLEHLLGRDFASWR